MLYVVIVTLHCRHRYVIMSPGAQLWKWDRYRYRLCAKDKKELKTRRTKKKRKKPEGSYVQTTDCKVSSM